MLGAAWACLRWPDTALAVLIGLLGLNGLYHHQVHRDDLPTVSVSAHASVTAFDLGGREQGPADAPLRAEVLLDLRCAHCATLRRPLLASLRGVRLRERLIARPTDPLSMDLVRWGLAAAHEGPISWNRYLAKVLGIPPEVDRSELFAEHGELLRRLDATSGASDALAPELVAIRALGYRGKTPLVILFHADGREIVRWEGALEPAAISARVAEFAGRPYIPP
jgi:hypothetical protein